MALAALAVLATQARAAVPHTVIAGETLWSIAAANNFTTDSLAAYNGLSADAQVYVGEKIQIPTAYEAATAPASSGTTTTATPTTAGGTSHVVQPGETLAGVAAANGISPETLAADNGLSSNALLIIGQQITIPATSTTATSVSSASSSPPPEEHPSWTSPIYCPSCTNGEAYLAS